MRRKTLIFLISMFIFLSGIISLAIMAGGSYKEAAPKQVDGEVKTALLTGVYRIKSVYSNKYMDVVGKSTANGTKINQWDKSDLESQLWAVSRLSDGSYAIININSGKALEVAGFSTANKAKIQQWSYKSGSNQKWNLKAADNVSWFIESVKSGKVIDVSGNGIDNGAILHLWENADKENQKWIFEPVDNGLSNNTYVLRAQVSNKYIDVNASGKSIGTNIQQWKKTAEESQKWIITRLSDGSYTIKNTNSGKVIDVAGASKASGAPLHQWTDLKADNQKWNIFRNIDGTYTFLSINSAKVMDVSYGGLTDGVTLQQWSLNKTSSQHFYLEDPAKNKASILFTFDDGSIDNLTNAAPILAKAGFRGTAYITREKAEQYWSTGIMNDEQLDIIYNQYGWDLANHTLTHTSLGLQDSENSLRLLLQEYLQNQNWLLQQGFNRAAYHVAYPYGFYTPELIDIIQDIGVKSARTVEYGFETIPITDFYQLKTISVKSDNIDIIKSRIDEAIENNYTLILLLHGVDPLTEENKRFVISPEQLQELVNHVQLYVNDGVADVQTISQWYSKIN